MKETANEIYERFEKQGLIIILCDCGQQFKSLAKYEEHKKICNAEGCDIFIGHK